MSCVRERVVSVLSLEGSLLACFPRVTGLAILGVGRTEGAFVGRLGSYLRFFRCVFLA